MRWEHVKRVPEFEKALLDVGLPVVRCERQTHPPHHIKTEYSRRLTLDEKEAATRAKAAIKNGTFDAANLRAWLTKKRKPKTVAKPIKGELVSIGLIEPHEELASGKPKRERMPEVENAMRSLGFAVDQIDRNTRGPIYFHATLTDELPTDEQARFDKQLAIIKQRYIYEKPLIKPAEQGPPKFPAPVTTTAPGVPIKSSVDHDPHEANNLRALAIEVIQTALKDAASTSTSSAVLNPNSLEKRNAINFLTDEYGAWADSRDLWCAMADLDADALREHALRRFS